MMSNFSFSNVPLIKHSRSRFDLSHGVKTSGNVGQLIPFDVQEVYAGDTFKVNTSCVSRLSGQFIRPVMDNLFLDVYYFFVPSRILYDKFVNIFGENTESAWANTQDYEVPALYAVGGPQGTTLDEVHSGSVADYMGLPLGTFDHPVSVLPFRAFAKIYDDWFRDENNVPPMNLQTGEIVDAERLNNNEWGPDNYCGKPPMVAKFHDLFTASLPAPQKGQAPDIPVSINGSIPVYAMSDSVPPRSDPAPVKFSNGEYGNNDFNTSRNLILTDSQWTTGEWVMGAGSATTGLSSSHVLFDNLWADPSAVDDISSGITVNDLRFAFQYQKMLERDARSGSRFTEYLQAHFGVSAGDYRLQRSEFLGGKRSPISIHQVTQTTGEGSDSSPLGSVGAFSLSNSRSRYTKGFVENGYVIGVFCIRQFHTYQQGIEKFWSRFKRTDFFDPVFSHIGEQPVYSKEIYADASEDDVFGYNEAWIDLRYRQSRVTGQMRSGISNSLDVWHFADYYDNQPVLGQAFIEETPTYVNRAITLESSSQDQFILDFYVQNIAYRALPTYSVPSLVDHD